MVEEAVFNKLKDMLMRPFGVSVEELQTFLLKVLEKMDKKFDDTPITNLLNGAKKGDYLKTIVVPDEEHDEFIEILKKTNIKNYVAADLTNDDAKMIIFAESDTQEVKKAIDVLKAERGLVSEIDIDSFLLAAKDTDIATAYNIDEAELECIRYHSREINFPYALTETENGPAIIFKEEDKEKVSEVLDKTAFNLSGEQGPLVRQQIEYKIKGRKEVNIALSDAEREFSIIDRKNPNNYLVATADDFVYYKNNKELNRISRKEPGAMEATYQKLEGLTEPVILTKNEFELNPDERQKVLESKTNVYPTGYSALDPSIEVLNQEEHIKEVKAYAGKFAIAHIENDKDNSLDNILANIEKIQHGSHYTTEKDIDKSER